MTELSEPLPPGSSSGRSGELEEVLVVRHSDPVQVRRAGAVGAFPMRFHSKRERVGAGAWVYTGAGGKAELLWPREGLSAILFDDGVARVGEREPGEPAVHLWSVSRVDLQLVPGALVALPGGALLEGDPERRSGPFVLVRIRNNVLRLKNQSKGVASVRYREDLLRVSPGQVVDLPLMELSTAPLATADAPLRVDRGGAPVLVEGPVDPLESDPAAPSALWFEARGTGTVSGQGVRVRLAPGQRAGFVPLPSQQVAPAAAPAGGPPPAPGPLGARVQPPYTPSGGRMGDLGPEPRAPAPPGPVAFLPMAGGTGRISEPYQPPQPQSPSATAPRPGRAGHLSPSRFLSWSKSAS